jgi:predicted enzyme related to lactoylglutathione lyase
VKINNVFLSINADDFSAQSEWWANLIGRNWDREPMPSCHEWSLTDDILFQVLDSSEGHGGATVTLHVHDLNAEINRLDEAGIEVPQPVKVEGFDTLRYSEFADPEGNTIGLLDGN